VAAMIALPAAFNVLVLIALKTGGHPRILIYVLPLALVVAVRGAFVIGGFLAERFREEPAGRRIGRHVGTLLVAGLFSASLLSLVHYYRYPKQDFTGSLSFVREQMAPNDVAAAVHHAGSAYRLLYGPDLQFPLSVEELEELRDHQGDTWVIITLRHLLKRRKPVMYEYLKKEFTPVKVFPGTLGGGAVWVLRDREP
jgi:hypothetical protein